MQTDFPWKKIIYSSILYEFHNTLLHYSKKKIDTDAIDRFSRRRKIYPSNLYIV